MQVLTLRDILWKEGTAFKRDLFLSSGQPLVSSLTRRLTWRQCVLLHNIRIMPNLLHMHPVYVFLQESPNHAAAINGFLLFGLYTNSCDQEKGLHHFTFWIVLYINQKVPLCWRERSPIGNYLRDNTFCSGTISCISTACLTNRIYTYFFYFYVSQDRRTILSWKVKLEISPCLAPLHIIVAWFFQ